MWVKIWFNSTNGDGRRRVVRTPDRCVRHRYRVENSRKKQGKKLKIIKGRDGARWWLFGRHEMRFTKLSASPESNVNSVNSNVILVDIRVGRRRIDFLTRRRWLEYHFFFSFLYSLVPYLKIDARENWSTGFE